MPTYATGSAFWPAVNLVNFRFLEPSQRVLYVNAAGLLWNVYLSYANTRAAAAVAADTVAGGKGSGAAGDSGGGKKKK